LRVINREEGKGQGRGGNESKEKGGIGKGGEGRDGKKRDGKEGDSSPISERD